MIEIGQLRNMAGNAIITVIFHYLKIIFFRGAQGCGRMGDSFLWEGSLFVFQSVGGGGRGYILAKGY